ncbi:hypothetical protein VPH35_095837 [Triticum aestivum]|uniref:Uncharacterized protein n=4 Tax=Triticinae TaxID=1648030 RepID=A0A453JPS1_AEGTS|nr:uncharacterized protein LOC123124328 [Triticum aestivum]
MQHHGQDVPPAKRSTWRDVPSTPTMVDRHRAFVAAAAATLCLFFAHGVAAARPLEDHRFAGVAPAAAAADMVMDVSAASPDGSATWERGDEALRAGKWLPLPLPTALTGGLRFPGVFQFPAATVGASMPWMAGAPPALAGPGMPALVPPYVGVTRQEQLSVWASLFNPFRVRPRVPAQPSSVPAEPRVPAVASAGLDRTTTVDQPAAGAQIGEPKWGVFLGSATPNNNG